MKAHNGHAGSLALARTLAPPRLSLQAVLGDLRCCFCASPLVKKSDFLHKYTSSRIGSWVRERLGGHAESRQSRRSVRHRSPVRDRRLPRPQSKRRARRVRESHAKCGRPSAGPRSQAADLVNRAAVEVIRFLHSVRPHNGTLGAEVRSGDASRMLPDGLFWEPEGYKK